MPSNIGLLEALFTLFAIVLGIAWIIRPFALFGIKSILRELLSEIKKANEQRERSTRV